MTRTWKGLLGVATLAACAVLGTACNKDDEPRVIGSSFVDVDGEYLYTAELTSQTCGLDVPGFTAVMRIEQSTTPSKTVAIASPIVPEPIPCGDRVPPFDFSEIDPAGTCHESEYTLQGRALRALDRVGYAQLDTCVLKLVGDTTFTFDEFGFTGTETYQVTAESGCDQAFRPCEMTFAVSGERCADCFECTAPRPCE